MHFGKQFRCRLSYVSRIFMMLGQVLITRIQRMFDDSVMNAFAMSAYIRTYTTSNQETYFYRNLKIQYLNGI